jgi:hypothetical protein
MQSASHASKFFPHPKSAKIAKGRPQMSKDKRKTEPKIVDVRVKEDPSPFHRYKATVTTEKGTSATATGGDEAGAIKWAAKKARDSENGGCFVSTACVNYAGLPDDCWELRMLRLLRERHVQNSSSGRDFLERYPKTSKLIIEGINNSAQRESLWAGLLEKCRSVAALIADGRDAEAWHVCKTVHDELLEKHCGADRPVCKETAGDEK